MIVDLSNKNYATRGIANTLTNGVISTPANSFADFYFPVSPLSKIEVECEARIVTGSGGTFSLDLVSSGTSGTVFDFYDLTKKEWEKIKMVVIVPAVKTERIARLSIGVRSNGSGTCEYRNVNIKVTELENPTPKLIACGRINHVATSMALVQLNPDYVTCGVKSLLFNGTDTITVSLNAKFSTKNKPIITVTGINNLNIVPLAGDYDSATNSFTIKFTNGTSVVNILAIAPEVYFEVKA